MASEAPNGDNASGPVERAVLIVPAGEAAPAPLVRALARKRLSPVVVTDTPTVMACLAHNGPRVVIAVAPRQTPGLHELASAMGRHYPESALGQLQCTARGSRLTPIVTPHSAKAADGHSPSGQRNRAEAASRSLTGVTEPSRPLNLEPTGGSAGSANDPISGNGSHGSAIEPATVTTEELAMLLGGPTAASTTEGDASRDEQPSVQ